MLLLSLGKEGPIEINGRAFRQMVVDHAKRITNTHEIEALCRKNDDFGPSCVSRLQPQKRARSSGKVTQGNIPIHFVFAQKGPNRIVRERRVFLQPGKRQMGFETIAANPMDWKRV